MTAKTITVTFDPATHKVVPLEPTDDMEINAENDYEAAHSYFPDWKRAYRAMLAAAPTAAEPAGAVALTETQAQALRSATPGGDWFDEEQAAIFERGIRAAERSHGIAPAGGIGGGKP